MIKNTDERIQRYLTPFRYPEPVLTGSGIAGAFDEMAVDIPFVFRHQNKFYMLYTGLNGKGYQSALAVSDDLLHWQHKGIILKRRENTDRWDRMGGAATWLVKESDGIWDTPTLKKINGKYWMVYHSYPKEGYEEGPAEIGFAWTQDEELLDWHFPQRPAFSWRDGEKWEAGGLYKACLLERNGRFFLFYNAKDERKSWTEQTGMAWSEDMEHWTRCPENPILRVTPGAWDQRFVSDPCIVFDGPLWLNFYFGYGETAVDGHRHAQEGLALSKDMIHWEKVEHPVLPYGTEGENGCGHLHKASMVFYNGTLYHFYCGTRPAKEGDTARNGEEFRCICVAADKPVWKDI